MCTNKLHLQAKKRRDMYKVTNIVQLIINNNGEKGFLHY